MVAEVSNMGCFKPWKHSESKVNFAPGKAVNAGGVATSVVGQNATPELDRSK